MVEGLSKEALLGSCHCMINRVPKRKTSSRGADRTSNIHCNKNENHI